MSEQSYIPAPPYQPEPQPKAPEGTNTNTVWIWLVALLPLTSLLFLFALDVEGYMRSLLQNPTSPMAGYAFLFTPGYLLAMLLGWLATIAIIVFGYLDWRELKRRGVPAPFHWAFGFLQLAGAGIVYPIGRSVVVRRRAGGSLAPMIVAILVYVVIFIVSIIWSIVIMYQAIALVPQFS